MPIPPYVSRLRALVGHDLLMLPSVSAVVLNDDHRLLLNRRSDNGQWALIAGAIDPGEQPADAIIREIREETGVDAVIERLVGVALHPVRYPNGDEAQYLNVWFRCRAVGGEARVNDDESLEVGWFDLAGLPDDPWLRLRVDHALADEPGAWFAPAGASPAGIGF